MAWTVNAAVQVQNLVSTIQTNLVAGGWTDYDPGQAVYTSVNNQGVTQYVQITNVGAWLYLLFQGWRSWDAVAHTGTSGSGSQNRVYYAPAAVAAATLVDLYMSVTANRMIVFIQGTSNYRNWAYFGGLDTLAGTNDPYCAYVLTSYVTGSSAAVAGNMLNVPSGLTAWGLCDALIPNRHGISSLNYNTAVVLGWDFSKLICFPVLISDVAKYIRGNLDGLLVMPIAAGGQVGHLHTIDIGGVTYLITIPGGYPTGDSSALTGHYSDALLIIEA